MNIIRTGRNVTLIALLLSLLFHGSTIFYIFTQKANKFLSPSQDETALDLQNKQQEEIDPQKKDEWVETRARAGEFGAPVFFKDDPEEIEIDEPTPDQDLIMQQENTAPIEEPIPQEPEQTIEPSPSETAQELLKDNDAATKIPAAIVSNPEPKNTPKKAPRKRNAPARKKPQLTAPDTPRNVPKPPITFAQLAQGFLEQRKELAGSYGLSMLGMKQGMPADEQMKYERYLQKLSWCIQNSMTIHRDKQPPLSEQTMARLFFSLDRDGSLKQLYIKKSSGNVHIDQFILFIFRDASTSFPPIPGYLTDDPFSMMCVFR